MSGESDSPIGQRESENDSPTEKQERKERLLAGKRHDTGTVGDAGWQCRTVGAEDKLGP